MELPEALGHIEHFLEQAHRHYGGCECSLCEAVKVFRANREALAVAGAAAALGPLEYEACSRPFFRCQDKAHAAALRERGYHVRALRPVIEAMPLGRKEGA